MKKLVAMMLLVSMTGGFAARAELKWSDNFPDASKQAAEQGKYLLLNFSGSDWCGWCIRLDKEVFSQPEFQAFANENLVSVVLDFPRKKMLSPGVVQQNEQLQEKYGVRGYPTILVLSPSGDLVQKAGYRPGGAEAYVEHLKEIIANHKAATP